MVTWPACLHGHPGLRVSTDPKLDVTAALIELQEGANDLEPTAKRILPTVYAELRSLAAYYLRGERPGHTLQATALVHEAFLRLADQDRVNWRGRTHFFAVAAQAMRRVLVDHARARLREKRGGDLQRVTLGDSLPGCPSDPAGLDLETILDLDRALTKLAALDPRQADLVEQRFFGGCPVAQAATNLGVSVRTAEADWAHAKAWLSRELAAHSPT